MDQPVKRGPGRPPKRGEPKRAPFQTRIREALRDRLEEVAAANGRSLSEEIEQRLEDSFRGIGILKAAFGGETGWRLALLLFANFRPPAVRTIQIGQEPPALDWLEDPTKFEAALRTLIHAVWQQHPGNPTLDDFLEFLLASGRSEIARSQSGFIAPPQAPAQDGDAASPAPSAAAPDEAATSPAQKKDVRLVFANAA